MRGRATTARLLASAFVLALLALGLVDAPRGRADAPGATVAFKTQASNGNTIFGIAFSKRADGRGTITLLVGKKGAAVTYFGPATVVPSQTRTPSVIHPPSAIRADLGELGQIDLAFAPSGVVKREHSACDKTTLGFEAGSYWGTFEFQGEEGYAEATETSVPALIRPLLNLVCGGYVSGEAGGPGLPGARLGLLSTRGGRTVHLQANKNRPGAATFYEATLKERSGRVQIQRSIGGKAPAASFVFSNGLRLATFEPPAPFDGRAVFRRNASPRTAGPETSRSTFPASPMFRSRTASTSRSTPLNAPKADAAHRVGPMADKKLDDPQHELFLIDGNSLAYRAFFALPESIGTSDGRPTNAIYGLASMLVKCIDEHHPAGVVVAWDAGMSGREITYDLYKAQRKPRPDLLREQWPHLMPLVEAFGYTNVKVEGFEADDVIASLARQAREEGIPVMVVTGDRDAYQLVGEGVRVMSTSRGITETKIYDANAVTERYGVPPELITDLMGLRGDTSDNIPGVPGIGEKTATQLLQRFGDLEGVLGAVDEISGAKRKQNLVEHADDARMSKQLATLQYEIETGVDLGEVMASEPDRGVLREFMREFELRAVLERLEEALPEGEAVPGRSVETELAVEAEEGKPEDLSAGEGPVALAIDGDRWAAAEDQRTLSGSSTLDELAVALPGRGLDAHDAKSLGGGRHGLLAAAAREGVELGLDHDTMLAAYLLEPQRRTYELPELAADAGIGIAADAAPTKDEDDGQLSLEGGGEGEAGLDPADEARLVAALADAQRPRVEELGLADLLREIELPLVHVLAAMEREGLKLDARRLAEVGAGFGERIETLEREIFELAEEEFTIGSPQQVGRVLFEKLGLTRKRRGKTGFSTDARVLAQIRDEHPIVEKIESWRELTKLKNTYLDSLPDLIDPETGRVHTTFNQAATTTGRLSSTNPNLQNIPIRTEIGRPVRACFVAEKGARLLSADYSQVELRVLAHVADEEVLKEIFRAGEDVHAATAAEVFEISREDVDVGQRSKAKMVNFGIVYGLTGFGLADRLNIPRKEGEEFVSRYLERFPAVRAFREEVVERAQDEGYVTTLLGRRRSIPELRSGNPNTRRLGERLAVNTVIQGTAADVIKIAMVRCQRALRDAELDTRLVLQIHDELLFEGPPAEMDGAVELVEREMCAAYQLDPPLEVDIGVGRDWLDAK